MRGDCLRAHGETRRLAGLPERLSDQVMQALQGAYLTVRTGLRIGAFAELGEPVELRLAAERWQGRPRRLVRRSRDRVDGSLAAASLRECPSA